MRTLRNLAIQEKMSLISLLTCGAVLCLAIVSLFIFQVLNFRGQFQSDTCTLATIIANNSTAAMEFKDPANALEIIQALAAKSSVVAATLATPDGQPFAEFGKPEARASLAQFPPEGESRFENGQLLVTRPVLTKGEKSGTLYMQADYRSTFRQLLEVYVLVVCGIVMASTFLALYLSRRLGRRITGPILDLAHTAERVGENKNYSLRAVVPSDRDEVARLTESFNDMLSRIQSHEAELDKLNRQLITTSRMAGMAEVATGVLHNVGNVLNSLSVSATIVADGFRNSKLSKLKRVASMLREQNGHLASFLTQDPKGKVIPDYIVTVVGQMSGEESRLATHIQAVGTHIEHIKEIVAMQQSYAKVSGVYENLEVHTLVEDALRMNAAAFDRHGIELTRQFAPDLPSVCVDRHKVLQILINLLRNAKYAMDQRGESEKHLVVSIESGGEGVVRIIVTDNGVGIAPENLKKIFNHGFTTKKDGHGFGLHSGANAAKEMGGSLTAQSDGLGKGATFVLELPTGTSPCRTQTALAETSAPGVSMASN